MSARSFERVEQVLGWDVFNDPEDEEYTDGGTSWLPNSTARRRRCWDLAGGDPVGYRYLWEEMPIDELYTLLAMNNAKAKEERDRNRRKRTG